MTVIGLGPVNRLRALLSALPSLPELVPTQLTILLVTLPLCGYRWMVGRIYDEKAAIWGLSTGELQFWLPVGLVSALVIALAPQRAKRPLQAVFHGLCFILMGMSGAELAFFAVTGSRVDWDALGFLLGDLQNVLPVALSEVKGQHVLAGVTSLILCFGPMVIRPKSRSRWGLLVAVPALALAIWLGNGGRRGLRPPMKELQPSLAEQLWWDGLDRMGDTTLPPTPEDVRPRTVSASAPAGPNFVLILLESVGWQTTSFGGQFETTPNLKRFAATGLTSDHMYAVVPHTSKALVSTMCGDWPMLRTDIGESRPGGIPGRCLPDLLRDLGYSTAFFQTANEHFESRTELINQFGFQFFRARASLLAAPTAKRFATVNYFGLEDRAMLAPSMDWVTRQTTPFFAAYLTLATHHDYGVIPNWNYTAIGGRSGKELHYLNNIKYTDDFVNRLVTAYGKAGLADNTVFVVLGDHGEAFGQHQRFIHDMVIHDEGLHIPLVIWGPGIPTGQIEGDRQQVDVLPTIVELAGGTLKGSVRGSSLLAPAPERSLHHSCWRSHRCLAERTAAGVKTIDLYNDGPMQVFNILDDPMERKNLANDVESKEAIRVELRSWRDRVNGRYDEMLARWRASMQEPDARPAVHSWPSMDMMGCVTEQGWAVPGQTFWVDCSWRMPREVQASLRVFVRFGGKTRTVRPLAGVWPTWKWIPGWTVSDSVPVRVPDDALEGELPIEMSWDDQDWVTVGKMLVQPDR